MVRSSQWDAAAVMTQMAAATLRTLPPPADGVLYLIGDSTVKDQRGRKHPLGHTTRHSEHDPSTFGFEMVLMIASGERFRVPIALVPIDPQMKGHQNILFRQLLQDFVPPSWTRPVVVIADAGFCGTGASGHAGREYLMPHYETVRPAWWASEATKLTVDEAKRTIILGSKTNLVEIDLLRAGRPLPPFQAGQSDYRILISPASSRPRAMAYTLSVRDPLPIIPIPLRPGDPEPTLALNQLLHDLYDRARYDLAIDYSQPPVPPLHDDDTALAAHPARRQSLASAPRSTA